ncbi:hypothetical protein F0562_004554 [Nyssa sinensis]|uniref:Glycosyltransferase family 92 protein n=1 Tax=Nyssa sinensis TaxID=561372 RepID=A0A5J5BYK7_9ASTE|nr:hypothetical protein F0562_004554 [Nyssa sinensis]
MEAINSSAGAVVPSHAGFMSIKLDRTNYPLWLAQIVPILKSKNLMGFVTGTNPCPSEFKRNTDGTVTTEVDPRYDTWHQQDQMILSWINNSLSPTVLSTVARFTSSQATWSSLEKRYASQSKNRILQLRHDLLTVKGDGLSISDFVDKINQIANNLALAGKPVDDDDLVNIILNNVGPAYEVTVSSAQARDTSISYDDLVALLLNAEMRLKAQQTPSLEASPTAMGPSGFHRNQNWSQPQSGSVSFGNSVPMPSRPPCQICNRSGHSALDCYQRMNHAYEGRIPTQKLTAMAAIASSNIPSTTWISDSGASNHITADLTNLAIHNEYQGKDHVAVGCKDGEDAFRGKSEHGLYPFRIHTQISTKSGRPFALVGVRVSVPIWHSRLGHPANNTLSHLISNKCLLMHETASPDFNSPLEIVTEPLPHIPLASTGSPNTSIPPPNPPTQNPPNVPPPSITPTPNILIPPPIITEPTQPHTTPIPNPLITEPSPPTTNLHPMVTRRQAGISKPNPKYALNIVGSSTMRDRRKRGLVLPWNRILGCILFLVFFSGFTFSTLRLFFRETFRPRLVSSWPKPVMRVISGDSPGFPSISIRETVEFQDQALIFLTYPPSTPLFTKDDIHCVYVPRNSSEPQLMFSPVSIDGDYLGHQIVRCPLQPRGLTVSVALKSNGRLPSGPRHRWDSLAYEAMIDRDNTTIVFVKGLNLRSGRVYNTSRFECVYGWDFRRPKFLLRSDVISIAQEIVRCKTPLSILNGPQMLNNNPIKVSIRVIGKGILHSVARPDLQLKPNPPEQKQHQMCVCTMVRNQARFLREWVTYHARIGVEQWFIYDNNSDDYINNVIESLGNANFNISRHLWPWIKTQEAGFAHCAVRARDSCEWVGFIDVDEFLHLPLGLSLPDVLRNQSRPSKVAELRTSCYSFGPSGLKRAPVKGVMVGYTCRIGAPERHKSIVRPEALNSTLINLVHHFHLRDGFEFENMDRNVMVINHYKYQVWEVFKEKFYRRVATYVADWQEEENVGSKDRTPGLGTRAVEPPDWSSRFCEVRDTGLRDRVLEMFGDQETHMLPWQEDQYEEEDTILVKQNKKKL